MRGVAGALLLTLAAGPAFAQERPAEPDPIPSGVAPRPGEYPWHVDVLHYEVELGVSHETDWFAGRSQIRMVTLVEDASVRLDFSGLAVDEVLVNGAPSGHDYEAGSLTVPLAGVDRGDTATVHVAYQGVPDDGLTIRDNVHGARYFQAPLQL